MLVSNTKVQNDITPMPTINIFDGCRLAKIMTRSDCGSVEGGRPDHRLLVIAEILAAENLSIGVVRKTDPDQRSAPL